MATATQQRPKSKSLAADELESLIAEVKEYYDGVIAASKAVKRATPGSDEHEEALGDLASLAFTLELKAQAINLWLDHETFENLIDRLERLRAKLSARRPVSVARFLHLVRETLKLKAEEAPSEITYRRWLRQAKRGILRISPSHEALMERFLEKAASVK